MNYTYSRHLSGAVLKHIAILTMLVDHATYVLYAPYYEASTGASYLNSELYALGRIIGRLAFVLFAFQVTESMRKGHHPKRYLRNLLLFSFISEIPYDLAFFQSPLCWDTQNVFWTLFFGALAIYILQCTGIGVRRENEIECNGTKKLPAILGVIGCLLIAGVMKTDYGLSGVLFIVLLYLFADNVPSMILFAFVPFLFSLSYVQSLTPGSIFPRSPGYLWRCLNWYFTQGEVAGVLAFLPIWLYDGSRGTVLNKWFYYFFYPVHLLLLWALACIWF